jgi:predicted O-methyltransferase YrrM
MFDQIKKKINEFNAEKELKKIAPLLNKDASDLNADQLVELLYSSKWERFFWTKQVKKELVSLASLVEETKPKVVVEIGTNTGGTFFMFAKLADSNAKLVSIDLPGGKGGGGYPEYKTDFFRSFGKIGQQLYFIKGDSQSKSTYQQLKSILGEDEIDFLFIDGDHSYEGVKNDFQMYSTLVKDKGLIAFHDIKYYPDDHWIKVDKLWAELKGKYQHYEFFDNSFNWGGIGVIVKNNPVEL